MHPHFTMSCFAWWSMNRTHYYLHRRSTKICKQLQQQKAVDVCTFLVLVQNITSLTTFFLVGACFLIYVNRPENKYYANTSNNNGIARERRIRCRRQGTPQSSSSRPTSCKATARVNYSFFRYCAGQRLAPHYRTLDCL